MTSSPNAQHIALWNDALAPKFIRFRRAVVEGMTAHSRIALGLHPPAAGAHVLDVGCGFGDTSIELARLVGGAGSVVGIDCCAPFLDVARADAQAAGASNVRFVLGDAQTESFPADFDLCFARFGTMFFDDPVAAMGNLRRAMRSGGRLLMLVWRRLEDNEGVATAKAVVRRHLPPAPGEAASGGPGPYSMADPDEVRALLEAAGWTGAAFEPIDAAISIGATLDDAVAYSLTFGPAGEILRKAGELGEAKRPLIATDLRAAFAPRLADGGVMVGSSSWCVTAAAG